MSKNIIKTSKFHRFKEKKTSKHLNSIDVKKDHLDSIDFPRKQHVFSGRCPMDSPSMSLGKSHGRIDGLDGGASLTSFRAAAVRE